MNYNETIKDLAAWIEDLKEAARRDDAVSISWFNGTKDYPFAIIGGWVEGFGESYSDIICTSKVDPCYAMCLKIAINKGPYAYTDYEIMHMPYNEETGDVDDTEQALEWDDDAESLATWFLCEWERIMKEHGEEI